MMVKISKGCADMNVFIFGAGADKNFCDDMPVGNEFIIEIFSNLDEIKAATKEDKDQNVKRLYENFKNRYSEK